MGVVRRTGDWRLEKREEGVYEVTFRNEPQLRVLTPDAPPYESTGVLLDLIPIEEVRSYSEAEGLFEEKAHGPPPLGMEYSSDEGRRRGADEDDVALTELPVGALGGVCVVLGAILVFTFIDGGNSIGLTIGLAFGTAGILPFVYAGYLSRECGWQEGFSILITPAEEIISEGTSKATGSDSHASADEDQEKTPPPSQNLKNELFFERANRRCEYCENQFDQLHIHHIKPRREGGPNTRKNLIVLCPNCHSKADSGTISRSKLRYQVKERLSAQD